MKTIMDNLPLSRTKNTKRNIIFSYVDTIVTFAFQFVSRTIIIHTLGEQYLGLSSLFTSILQVLNMAELGFSSAVIYNMYKPIAHNDTKTVCALLNYYRKIYRTIAIIIISIGIPIAFFLPYLIEGTYPTDINIYILYFLYLANTASSYIFFAYKTALLNALQRLDLTKIAYTIIHLIQYTLQVLSLLVFKNYYAYATLMVIGTISKNTLTAWISKNNFPQYKCEGIVSKETRREIISKVKGLLVCNISGITYTTFDSIILSSFMGLAIVAKYNNYITAVAGITTFIVLIRNAMQASVGNSVAIESTEKNYKDMQLWQFLFSSLATWCSSCMICLFQPLMILWMGENMLLPFADVVLLTSWFFVSVVQNAFFLYLSGTGMWWEMRWPYILSTVTNLVLNIVLGKLFSTTGIILSTLISSIIYGLIWQCAIIFKKYYHKNMAKYQLKQLYYTMVCCVSCSIGYLICSQIDSLSFGIILLKGIICTVVSFIAVFLFCHKSNVYADAITFMKRLILKPK